MHDKENLILTTTPRAPRSKQKREKSTTTKGHYVTNSVLLPAVIEAKAMNVVTDKLIRMIQMIAERYSRKSNFVGYSFREDMVCAATLNLCNNALKFNPEKSSNPFSFYTTAIHNSFLQFMADEKKHRNIRDALLIDAGSNPSFNFMQGEKDEIHFEVKESDDIHVHIRNQDYDDGIEPAPAKPKIVDGEEVIVPVKKVKPRETKIGYKDREPSKVVKWSAKDISFDADGNLVLKAKKPPKPEKEVKIKSVLTSILDKVEPVKKVAAKKVVTAKKKTSKKGE